MRTDERQPKPLGPQPHWQTLVNRFPDGRDCLVTFLAYESAEVLAGVKPANLINLIDRSHHCGRNFYRLWRRFGNEVIGHGGLIGLELIDRGDSMLLLVYAPPQIDTLLGSPAVRAMLRRAGYHTLDEPLAVLDQLQQRCRGHDSFPHEIGIFLGYPLKDVAAFMGWVKLPFTAQGPWKIYGQSDQSLQLATTFRRCRETMTRRLANCTSPMVCLTVHPANGEFLVPSN